MLLTSNRMAHVDPEDTMNNFSWIINFLIQYSNGGKLVSRAPDFPTPAFQ